MNDFEDGLFVEAGDEFDGDDAFRDVIVGNRTETETRDVVAELDAEWFRQNPGYRQRVREYVPGEFDSASGGFCGDAEGFVVLTTFGGVKVLLALGSFDERGWKAGGLQ